MKWRIAKVYFNDGSEKFQIKLANCRGGFDAFLYNGEEIFYDTFNEAYTVLHPNKKLKPYVIKEEVVFEE